MILLKNALTKFIENEEGLSAVEYAVGGALVVGAMIVGFQLLGTNSSTQLNDIAVAIQ